MPRRPELRTMPEALAHRLSSGPGETFYVDADGPLTIAGLAGEVDAAARRLHGLGLRSGEHVVTWLPNGRRWISLLLACAQTGVVLVTAGPRLRLADLRYLLDHSGARTLFYTPSFLDVDYDQLAAQLAAQRDRGGLRRLEHVVRCAEAEGPPGTTAWASLPVADALPEPPPPGAPALICYTGGTTGRPKGCVHDQATLMRNAAIAAELTGFAPGEVLVSSMPFAHVFGFHMSILQPLLAGASLVEAEPFSADRTLDLIAEHGGTVVYGVPAMGAELAAAQRDRPRDLSSLRIALLAGAPVPPRLRRTVREALRCDLTVVYGTTESPTLTQLLPGDAPAPALESVGRATPGIEIAIVAPGTTEQLPAGRIGEIASRGYNHMLGYLDDPAATSAKYRGDWIVPGDFGRLDEDGFLYVTGRAENMFLCGGFNVYPREVENQLELLDGVDEVVVVGVPDERLGEVGLAFVTLSHLSLSENAILEWAREHMASYKRPRYVCILEAMPRTQLGKTAVGELAARARAELPDLPWSPE